MERVCHPANFSIQILSTYFFYALSDYGTEKLIRDDFLVTWLILGHVTNCCKRPIMCVL